MKVQSQLKLAALLCSLAVSAASAQAPDPIVLSKSFTLELPAELNAQMGAMFSQGGFWIDGNWRDNKVSIWVQRVKAPAIANSFYVNRFWKDGIKQTEALGEKSVDQGCHALEKFVFQCSRLTQAKNERFAHETLVWNAKSDLIVIRVMSAQSFEDAEAVSKSIHYKRVSRLPAAKGAP